MSNLVMDCPHCGAQRQSFSANGGYFDHEKKQQLNGHIWHTEYAFFSCNHCRRPITIEFQRRAAGANLISQSGFRMEKGFRNEVAIWVGPVWLLPNSRNLTDIPENILRFFEQGTRALGRGDSDAAGMTFRKALDAATRNQIRDLQLDDLSKRLSGSLHQRIEFLHSQRKLTDELKDWAHIIRDEGNDAAHEEQPYEQTEAEELGSFTEIYLQYVFALPARIAAKREKAEDSKLADNQQKKSA